MMDVESREKPFGQLMYGFGNTGKDRKEGSVKGNSIFTNTLGPILVLNPWLTKKIVMLCTGCEDFDFDMSLEHKSLETKKQFTAGKVSRLTNCK
jgi:CobQ-like glutamine amidotransferase family enzyme